VAEPCGRALVAELLAIRPSVSAPQGFGLLHMDHILSNSICEQLYCMWSTGQRLIPGFAPPFIMFFFLSVSGK